MHNSADAINKAKMKWRKIAPKKPDKEEEEEKLYAHPYIRGCAHNSNTTLYAMLDFFHADLLASILNHLFGERW